jgi:hypothetical protein
LGRWRSSHATTAKLHLDEVRAIRSWAQSTGFGLSVGDQIRVLQTDPSYAMLHRDTLRAILLNQSWPDLAYDHDRPMSLLPLPVLTARAVALSEVR